MAGLWPSSEGIIRVPKDILFLPQTPYLVDGSLRDQISSEVSDESVMGLLEKVRLSHLAGMIESFDIRQEWYKLLSPGEQQRLAMIRVFYSKPRFLVLDEALNAVDEESVEYFYNLLSQLDITIISVSHQPNIIRYHTTLLYLDGKGGYTTQKIT